MTDHHYTILYVLAGLYAVGAIIWYFLKKSVVSDKTVAANDTRGNLPDIDIDKVYAAYSDEETDPALIPLLHNRVVLDMAYNDLCAKNTATVRQELEYIQRKIDMADTEIHAYQQRRNALSAKIERDRVEFHKNMTPEQRAEYYIGLYDISMRVHAKPNMNRK